MIFQSSGAHTSPSILHTPPSSLTSLEVAKFSANFPQRRYAYFLILEQNLCKCFKVPAANTKQLWKLRATLHFPEVNEAYTVPNGSVTVDKIEKVPILENRRNFELDGKEKTNCHLMK